MKKEWAIQFVTLVVYYLDYSLEIYRGRWEISQSFGKNLVFILFHGLLFLIVNYVLIPRFFYKRKITLFFFTLIALIVLFGIFEEGVLEKWLYPDSRGLNSIGLRSTYHFFGEIFAPLLAFASIKIVSDNIANQKRIEQIEKDSLTNELKFLKSQIQPHILFNSLNNLYEYTLSKSDKAPDLVLQLSNVLRYVLYETTAEHIALSKELHFVKEYIALQEIQLEGRGQIDFNLEHQKPLDQLIISPFLMIPFIENCFKHSLGTKAKGIQILIRIKVENQTLQLFTQNNFEQHPKSSSNRLITKGVGLENVKKRLELLYPNRYQLDIKEHSEKYTTELELKLDYEKA